MSRGEVSQARRVSMDGSARYLNVVLTAIALALGVIAMKQSVGLPQAAEAAGQRTTRSTGNPNSEIAMGIPNAGEQRNRMIDALRSIDSRLNAIEAKLTSGPIDVRVVELPEQPHETE